MKTDNHYRVSMAKSWIRIGSLIWLPFIRVDLRFAIIPAVGLIVAEALGIIEEMVIEDDNI